MTHLLDTNACIALMRGKPPLVVTRFQAHRPADLGVCSVVVGELCDGAARHPNPPAEQAKVDAFLAPFVSLSFDDPAARRFATVRADLDARGLPIPDLDVMIAAIALVHDLTLVTHNTKHFGRIRGLRLEDWEVP